MNSPTLSFNAVSGGENSEPVISGLQTISFDSGKILVNGQVIAEGIKDLTFNLDGNVLTVSVEIEREVSGTTRTVLRRRVAQIRL